jgi:hypothetical protein
VSISRWCKTGKHGSSQVQDVCERLFNKRFELDELKEEIADKAFWVVSDFTDAVGKKNRDFIFRFKTALKPSFFTSLFPNIPCLF